MKVLHIWSVAGVAEVLAKFMDRLKGTSSLVLVRRKFDKFGFNEASVADGRYAFALKAVVRARDSDVVQVHNWDRILPWVSRFSSAPTVITYHNFNIANEWEQRRRFWSRAARRVIATPGLADGKNGADFIPEPVDTDVFYDARSRRPGTALHFEYGATEEAKAFARELGLDLTTVNRDTAPVAHGEMPALLNRYEYYIDVKRSPGLSPNIIEATGKTCLEALACGCKVIRWDGKVLSGLPLENRPESVVDQYYALYEGLLRGAR